MLNPNALSPDNPKTVSTGDLSSPELPLGGSGGHSATGTVDRMLHEHGLRATPQRVVVMEALQASSHPDAEAVFLWARARQPSMSRATVYHILEKFRESGLVTVMEFSGRRFYDGRTVEHDHVRCRVCGRLEDVERVPETHLVEPVGRSWALGDPLVLWYGVCPECRKASPHA